MLPTTMTRHPGAMDSLRWPVLANVVILLVLIAGSTPRGMGHSNEYRGWWISTLETYSTRYCIQGSRARPGRSPLPAASTLITVALRLTR